MKCHYHPDLDSVNICSTCSRSLCQSCAHTIKGRVLCSNCLVAGAELAAIATSPRLANYSPGRAAFFALIPGIGAVYNQQYVKAVQHFTVFAALVMLADRGPEIFVFAAISFWVFTIIDAYRSAQSILRHAAMHPGAEHEEKVEVNVPIWGGVLVALGIIFFLDNLHWVRLGRLLDFAWPLLFVAAGAYLILDFYRRDRSQPNAVPLAATAAAGSAAGGATAPPAPYESPQPPSAPPEIPALEAESDDKAVSAETESQPEAGGAPSQDKDKQSNE
ncbi:MAG: DUF5668 domain-containing protein [Acidobacteriota bacterium]